MKKTYLIISFINWITAVCFLAAGVLSTSKIQLYGFIFVSLLFIVTGILNFKKYKSQQ
ncbi:hypothetical protein O9H85_17730 [Paenibacillus filicis]|uniref:Uncharacterized protein n=1 Tax=Paenibacillus gyeongsangnamensis TaxID=3388067 RepID=A0ABT4QBG5_9BACL|nr:hypothetical protein [Paenibacillus filicis]MCZ8514234.1 hypothetical protein [Paenibacillus filicis]